MTRYQGPQDVAHEVIEGAEAPSLSGLISRLFRGTGQIAPEEFHKWAFALLEEEIAYDSCFWGIGSVQGEQWLPHSFYLGNQPMQMMENYAQYIEQDFLSESVRNNPGKTIDPYLLIPREEFVATEIYQKHVKPYHMEHTLCTAIRHPISNLFNFISLYRADYGHPYSEQERKTKEFLTPLLVDAYNLNLFLSLKDASSTGFVSAICDKKGFLREAEPEFTDMMLREWPEWRGPVLPFAPEPLLAAGTAQLHNIVIRLQPWNDLIQIEVREKGGFDSLTRGEQQVAGHLTEGLTNKEIANVLGISPKTVGNHLHHIFAKLGVPNRQRAIAMLKGEI